MRRRVVGTNGVASGGVREGLDLIADMQAAFLADADVQNMVADPGGLCSLTLEA